MKSIRAKITLVVAIIVIVAIALTTACIVYNANNELQTSKEEDLQLESDYYALEINQWFYLKKQLVSSGASSLIAADAFSNVEKLKGILSQHYQANADELIDFYFGSEQHICYTGNGDPLPDDFDPCSRDWYIEAVETGNLIVSEPYLDVQSEQMCATIATPVYMNDELQGVLAIDFSLGTITDIIDQIEYEEGSYGFLIDADHNYITHPNEAFQPTEDASVNADETMSALSGIIAEPGSSVVETKDYDGSDAFFATSAIESAGWVMAFSMPRSILEKSVNTMIKTATIIIIIALVIAILIMYLFISRMLNPVKKMSNVLVQISEGDFSSKVKVTSNKDEVGQLVRAVDKLSVTLNNIIGEANVILSEVATGNLIVDDMQQYPGSFNDLSDSVNSIKELLNGLLTEVKNAAYEVETGSEQLTEAADSLARGTSTQASSVHNLVYSVENINGQIGLNSDNCKNVNEKIVDLKKQIDLSNEEMTNLYQVVLEIEEMSAGIQKIVDSIDSIAFQTNILALNASVEAARAGDMGKGFAVVADEVGNLANKSAEESHNTSELIGRVIDAINVAKKHADATSSYLREVVDNAENISGAFMDISQQTSLQAENSTSIKSEASNISNVIEANSATASETAASTEALSKQAKKLTEMIGQFKTK